MSQSASGREPWDEWIPGVLSKNQLDTLCETPKITIEGDDKIKISESSIDLSLSNKGFLMLKGCIKPWDKVYFENLKKEKLLKQLETQKDDSFHLFKRNTYLFKLRENISPLFMTPIYGKATAKSTIGRVDVLARLIVEGMDSYEELDPEKCQKGDIFVEVTPMTFDVVVKEGTSLNQLRLFKGKPVDSIIESDELNRTILGPDSKDSILTVDLEGVRIGKYPKVVAFCARESNGNEPLELWRKEYYNPTKKWMISEISDKKRLRIKKENFYILKSKEMLAVPKGIAVYCRAIDETIGEMRIHYAGFVHPLWGKGREDGSNGTPLMFEVRGHNIDVILNDGERLARLIFYRMSEDYERANGNTDAETSNKEEKYYNEQTLKLSKIFRQPDDTDTFEVIVEDE